MALTVTLPAGDERVLLQDSSITLIEAKPSSSGTWSTYYSGAAVSQRYLYPLPNVAMDYRVNGTDTATNITLPIYCPDWGIFLTDTVDPTLHAETGLFSSYTGMQQEFVTVVKSYVPLGSTYPKDFPSRAKYRQWNNSFDLEIPATSVRNDGVVVDNSLLMANLRTMTAPRMVTTLWRDARGLLTYVKILDFKEWIAEDGGWTVEMVVEERQPPSYPFTSAT